MNRERYRLGFSLTGYVLIGALFLGGLAFFFFDEIWARALQEVYILTAGLFGVLFYAYWQSIGQRWFWKAMVPIALAHSGVLFAVVKLNLAFPVIETLPGRAKWSTLGFFATAECLAGKWAVDAFSKKDKVESSHVISN